MTLSSALTSLTRSSPTLTTLPSSGAVSTQPVSPSPPSVLVSSLLRLCALQRLASLILSVTPLPPSLSHLHSSSISGPSCHVNSILARTICRFQSLCVSFSCGFYLCLLMFVLAFRVLKRHAMWESFTLFFLSGLEAACVPQNPLMFLGLNMHSKAVSVLNPLITRKPVTHKL